ncbi:hypothetical protein [Microbispora sp. H10949]|uniref:hypothetical protein n=1 Tax=Microbispora sp. H10949 TaxID=2729111 RepID=UPI0016008652|nr:hypothetical protein [Microbispora sp. H10949]
MPRIDNGGSTTVTFPPVHLRPNHRLNLDPIVLVVEAPAPAVITAQWWAERADITDNHRACVSESATNVKLIDKRCYCYRSPS